MAFQVSPGVAVSEVDLSTSIPSVGVSDAAMAFATQWGPADEITTVTSERDLAIQFGKPDTNTQINWLTAASFLSYAGSLQIVRTIGSGAKNSTDDSGPGDEGGVIETIAVNAAGSNYVVDDLITISGNLAGGTAAVAIVTSVAGTGQVTGLALTGAGTNAGSGYSTTNGVSTSGGSGDSALTVNITASTEGEQGQLIKNLADFQSTTFESDTTFIARCPGAFGNGLVVGILHGKTASDGSSESTIGQSVFDNLVVANGSATSSDVKWADAFDDPPNLDSETQFVHVIVIDTLGTFSGKKNQILESHANVSLASDSKDDQGNSNYIVEVLERNSQYIWCTGKFSSNTNIGGAGNWDTGTTSTSFDIITDVSNFSTAAGGDYGSILAGGIDANGSGTGGGNAQSARETGYEFFNDPEQTDVSLFPIGHEPDTSTYGLTKAVITIASGNRKDAVVFTSPTLTSVQGTGTQSAKATAVVGDRAKINTGNSYAFMDSGWKRIYNKYTDKFVNIPLNGDVAGLCVETDNNRGPWYSPAGFNRGSIRNVASLLFDPNKTSRDTLYKKQINPIAGFPGDGVVLFGDKTMQAKPSAFDRINVRRLFIVLEKSISRAAKYSLFEFNDEFTRSNFKSLVDPYLRGVQGQRGITDYLVVCDESNNTSEVIDRNEFVGDIFIKPNRSINFIQLNFVAVKTGVSFSEVTGQV